MKKIAKKVCSMMLAFVAFALLGSNGVDTVEAADTTYFHAYSKHDYEQTSDRFSLTVNDKKVDVVTYFEGRYDYARLAYEGTATFKVKSLKGKIESYNVSPHGYNLNVKVSGDTLTFDMKQKESRYVLVEIKAGGTTRQIFIACDPKLNISKPDLSKSNVMNIRDRGIQTNYSKADGKKNSEIIQKAINELSSKGGGTLYFPAGTYKFVTLDAKSNVTIFLDEGAVLRGSGKRTDYDWADSGQNGRQVKRKDILIKDVKNFSIIGYGMIDGNAIPLALKKDLIQKPNVDNREQPDGYYPNGWDDFRKGIVDGDNSDGITFKGVAFKDATGWTFSIENCKNINVSNVKIIDDYKVVHSDGYDFCSCQNVNLTDCLGICGDDVYCPKAENKGVDTKDMLFKDSVAYARGGAGCKVGVAARSNASNIEFRNIDVIQGYRGFTLAHDEGTGKWENIRFIDVRTEKIYIPNKNNTGGQYRPAPFVIWTRTGGGTGPINNVEVTRCSVEDCSGLMSYIQGYNADAKVTGVTFTDLVLEGKKITQSNYKDYVVHGDNISNIKYQTSGSSSSSSSSSVVYEAEKANIAGGAEIVQKDQASGGKIVGNIGGDGKANGKVNFTVNAPSTGKAKLTIYYLLSGERRFYVTVNNGDNVPVNCSGGNWQTIKTATLEVNLKKGSNTIRLDNGAVDEWAPNLDKIEVEMITYEAEDAKIAGGAEIVNKDVASGDKMVGNIGGDGKANGKVTFTVNVASSGTYYLDIYYLLDGARTFYVTVNNGKSDPKGCKGDNWNTVSKKTIEIQLNKGTNSIRLDNGAVDEWAPNLDKIEIRKK